ncbi:pyridoxamine 5'-phosphate oxidase family protein [Streptomyces marincola]|uniref:pyridoxamine 5'-phosphate oxidase family protein n=1 Tax=Streptomyces marincola TaxID=2878388 RepID=UPI001CF4322D|nr:pyridoxamine 5'-phosphate oxidase family protein [Streptomyces marincola]UCM86689.1 pyridoxamine 5'-phosphate oxidase family protein [Streptomyces marincola]
MSFPPTGTAADRTPHEGSGYRRTARTTPARAKERVGYDRQSVHSVLDEGYVCHLGFVREGAPVVLPTLYAREGERLYLHGSTGATAVLGARGDGLAVCVTVTHVDGLVLARSAFHHSVNYRSVVAHGTAHPVRDTAEKARVLDLLVDHVVPGRAADCRPADPRELAATGVLALDLAEVSVKVRAGGPNDDPEDLSLPHWAGVLPVRTVHGPPVPAGAPASAPGYLTAYARA